MSDAEEIARLRRALEREITQPRLTRDGLVCRYCGNVSEDSDGIEHSPNCIIYKDQD